MALQSALIHKHLCDVVVHGGSGPRAIACGMDSPQTTPPTPRVLTSAFVLEPITALTEHPLNPREGDVGAIVESLDANGFFGAVVAQRSTGYILAGNHRYRAAVMREMESVPVLWVDVDDDHATRILLADNKTNDRASYDNAQLLDILKSLDDLSGTGYTDDDMIEIQRLVSGAWSEEVGAKWDRADPSAPQPDESRVLVFAPSVSVSAVRAAITEALQEFDGVRIE